MPGSLTEHVQLVYLQLIDRLTVIHMKVLAHLNNPAPYLNGKSFGSQSPMLLALDRFKNDLDGVLLHYVVAELAREGLLNVSSPDSLGHKLQPEELSKCRTSDFGRDFIRFITEKPE